MGESCDLVTDSLYIGNLKAARNRDLLRSKGISHLVVAGTGLGEFFPGEFQYKTVNAMDSPEEDFYSLFREIVEFIEGAIQGAGIVLVHWYCLGSYYGISRSSTVVMAYLIKARGFTVDQALGFLVSKHPESAPNQGFIQQLEAYYDLIVNPK